MNFFDLTGFILCAALIIYSGTRLSVFGDRIADLTGVGKVWLGMILMAFVTSLPELITGISSVAIIKAPNLAAGDIFGSCIFNLLILSLLDTRIRQPLSSVIKSSHIVAAEFGIILLAVSGIAIFLAPEIPSLLWISSSSFLMIGIYLAAIWGVFYYDKGKESVEAPQKKISDKAGKLKKAIWGYGINAMVVVAAALFLPYFGNHLAQQTGLGNSFFGTVFLAATTSLPELVVSFSALRIGSPDMAVGNLLGSNLFNIFILALDDVFYRDGSLFQAIDPSHKLSVFIVIIMTAIVGLGILFRPRKKIAWLFSIDTLIIVILYATLMVYLLLTKKTV